MTKASHIIPWVSLETEPEISLSPHLMICPFAGASQSAFHSWQTAKTSGLKGLLVDYPGHGCRLKEKPVNSIQLLAEELSSAILSEESLCSTPLLLCGHSMGAQVAFETAIQLESASRPPAGLVLSGCQAPHIRARRLLSHLEDDDFIRQLIAIGGFPPELQQYPDLLRQFMPLLRADFLATESYYFKHAEKRLHQTPVLLMYGSEDEEAYEEEVIAWHAWIGSDCKTIRVAGNHFYPVERPETFCRMIADFYRRFCFEVS